MPFMERQVELDYNALAKKAIGNWRKWEFIWWERPDDAENWMVYYTVNRDSGLIEQSNAAFITQALQRFTWGSRPSVWPQRHTHWACGWVDGFAVRVYDRRGRVTKAFRTLCDLQDRLANYPILDESDYSEREYAAAIAAVEQEGKRWVREDPPEDWPHQVYEWLSLHDDRQLENRDDQGAYPSDDSVRAALFELGLMVTPAGFPTQRRAPGADRSACPGPPVSRNSSRTQRQQPALWSPVKSAR
jgi:hypothetical protein